MMRKLKITNMSSVAIIYRRKNPKQIFIEIKDDEHPIKLVRRQLCPIGGNWIGESAKADKTPFDTLEREINEELSFERSIRNTLELQQLGQAESVDLRPTIISTENPTERDLSDLKILKKEIIKRCNPFGMYFNTVTKKALDSADTNNTRNGFTSLVSYYTSGLCEKCWHILRRLQKKFGNLSNESITVITDLEDILRVKTMIAFGHDHVLKHLFQRRYSEADKLIMVPNIESKFFTSDMNRTYEEYLEIFDVLHQPK